MRRPPSTYEREQALERQDGKCFYCNQPLGAVRTRNGREVTLRTHWDHLMPYAYDQNNSPDNFVAACHVCNGIKSFFLQPSGRTSIDTLSCLKAWRV